MTTVPTVVVCITVLVSLAMLMGKSPVIRTKWGEFWADDDQVHPPDT